MALSAEFDLAVILPDTGPDGARAVERRVREMLPDAGVRLVTREQADEVSGLMERARGAREP